MKARAESLFQPRWEATTQRPFGEIKMAFTPELALQGISSPPQYVELKPGVYGVTRKPLKPESLLQVVSILPMLKVALKRPYWILPNFGELLKARLSPDRKFEDLMFISNILTKLLRENPAIDKYTKIEVTASEDDELDKTYVTVIVHLDGTPKSIENYKQILSEFYKYPEKLKYIMITFKVDIPLTK